MGGVVEVCDVGAVDAEDVMDPRAREVIDNEINYPATVSARCLSMLVISGHTFLPTGSFNKIHQLQDEGLVLVQNRRTAPSIVSPGPNVNRTPCSPRRGL